MTGKEVIKILEENDWQLDRIRGSHHIMKKEGRRSVPVPVHRNQDLPKGLLSALKRQTGIDFSNP
jgi:predicted RNA binding protein YcfA (HicA-like mRNA interferase family)